MNLNWNDIKDVFSILAPLVIVFTGYKLVIESKYKRDLTRIDRRIQVASATPIT